MLTLYCDEEDDYGLREEGYLPPFDDVGFRYVKEAGLSVHSKVQEIQIQVRFW